MKRRKVLITGSTGFVGQYCLKCLIAKGYDVFATYRNRKVEDNVNIHWIPVDLLTDQTPVAELLQKEDISYLLHLAWDVTPGKYQNSASNLKWLDASLRLIHTFVESGGKRVVTAGTCFEYDFSDGILNEEKTRLKPDTLYGECKAALYNVLNHYCQVKNVSYSHGRIFYLYGPGENSNRVVPYVITELLEGRKAKCGSAIQQLDYLYVKDVAKAFAMILDSGVQGAVNIGSGRVFSLRSLLEEIESQMGIKDMIDFAEPAVGDMKQIIADSCRLRDEVGWKPGYSVQSGIDEFLKWMT